MDNITIGIIAKDKNIDNQNFQVISKNNLKYIHNKCNYISILNYDNNYIDTDIVGICDGIIFQGGNDIYPYHFQILDFCINNNIPVLGICMGHQIIGLYSIGSQNEDDLTKVDNHNNKSKKHNISTSQINELLPDLTTLLISITSANFITIFHSVDFTIFLNQFTFICAYFHHIFNA